MVAFCVCMGEEGECPPGLCNISLVPSCPHPNDLSLVRVWVDGDETNATIQSYKTTLFCC